MSVKHRTFSRQGFTIVELLVVIALIVIASSIIFIGGSGGDGAALSASQRIVSGVAKGARGQAILKNAKTRLIIHNDSDYPDLLGRQFGIVYWGTDTNGTDGWIAATQGVSLPDGIYFDPAGSTKLKSGWTAPTMTLDYPRRMVGANTNEATGGGTDEFYYYEFNSNGTMESQFLNSVLVIGAGVLKPGQSGYEIDFPEDANDERFKLVSALIFRRAGTTTLVDDPDAIR